MFYYLFLSSMVYITNKKMSKSNIENFIKYITSPLTLNAIDTIYKQNNVIFERVDLYRDFTLSLSFLIKDTYLGDDVMFKDKTNLKKHFDWCWFRTCESFISENAFFEDNQELYEYLKEYFYDSFYYIDKVENAKLISDCDNVFIYLFDYNQVKPDCDITTFIFLYKLFNKSIDK